MPEFDSGQMLSSVSRGQALPIRIAIIANLLFWGLSIPVLGGGLGINIMITLLCGIFVQGKKYRDNSTGVALALLVMLYGIFVFFMGQNMEGLGRMLFSALLFVCCCLAIKRLADRVDLSIPLLATRDLWTLIVLVFMGLMVHVAFFPSSAMGDTGLKASGFFREPSHLALTMSPVLFYLWTISTGRRRLLIVLAGLGIAVLSASSTLILFLLVLFVVYDIASFTRQRRLAPLVFRIVVLSMIVFGFFQSSLAEQFKSRYSGVAEFGSDSNLSSIVYVNGWMELDANLEKTKGLGLGFNMMGVGSRPWTIANEVLELKKVEEDLNVMDGSFILSKLGSEFGYLGILGWLGFLWVTWKSCRTSSFKGEVIAPENRVALFSLLGMVSIAGVIRSAGYFTGPSIVALFALFIVLSRKLPADLIVHEAAVAAPL